MGDVYHLEIAAAGEPGEHRRAVRRRVLMRSSMRLRGQDQEWSLTVKDLSAGGMKAISPVSMFPGARVEVWLPNIGWVPGEIARTEGAAAIRVRFAVAIDPERAQTRVSGSYAPAASPTAHLRRV
jgi:hypothetical protein